MENIFIKRKTAIREIKAHPLLILLTAAILIMACLRPGVAVTIGGQRLPGVFSLFDLKSCVAAAEAAALEITMKPTDLSTHYSVKPGIAVGRLSRDTRALERLLLEQAEGVAVLWVVRFGGELVGWVSDPSVLGELAEVMLAEQSDSSTVSAEFSQKLTVTRSYASDATETDPMVVSKKLRELAEVVTVKEY